MDVLAARIARERQATELSAKEADYERARARGLEAQAMDDSAVVLEPPPALVAADFVLGAFVDRGGQGVVYRGTDKRSGLPCAVKALRTGGTGGATLARALDAHRRCSGVHPSVCKLWGVFEGEVEDEQCQCMVMDLVEGHTLLGHLQCMREERMSERAVATLGAVLVTLLCQLREQRVVFRDLTVRNVMLTAQGKPVVVDFGLARVLPTASSRAFELCGVAHYCSPEMIQGHGVSFASDWWSLGVLLYECLTGAPPFRHHSEPVLHHHILTQPLRFPPYVGPEAQSLLSQLLERDPDKRLVTLAALDHPFLARVVVQEGVENEQAVRFGGKLLALAVPMADEVGDATPPISKEADALFAGF